MTYVPPLYRILANGYCCLFYHAILNKALSIVYCLYIDMQKNKLHPDAFCSNETISEHGDTSLAIGTYLLHWKSHFMLTS